MAISGDVAVVIAYRDLGCEHRRRSFPFVRNWWAGFGYDVVVEGGTSDESFTRASGINAAIRRTTADIIIQADPDSIVSHPTQVLRAVEMAAEHDGLVVAHDRYLYLTPEATSEVLTGRDPATVGPDDCDFHGTLSYGNAVVFTRSTWEKAHGFDERCGLHSGDDSMFAISSWAFTGSPARRVPGSMVHLWHPRLPQSIPGGEGYATEFALLAEMRDASKLGPAAVRALVITRDTLRWPGFE